MKKNIIFLALACMGLCCALTSCSDDPEDAVSKHVYGEHEAPYLRTDLSANIALSANFRKGHIAPRAFYLKDYAEKIQTKLGMTVDDMLSGVESGKVVFYNINVNKGVWDKSAPNAGPNGWGYNAAGNLSDTAQVVTVSLDKEAKALVVNVPETASGGVSATLPVGFAVNNGRDFDQYVRFNISYEVTDPSMKFIDITIPTDDYVSTPIKLSNYEEQIKSSFGMSVSDFAKQVDNSNTDGDIALYMIGQDNNWITDKAYTAGGIGYWCNAKGEPMKWSGDVKDGNAFFVEVHGENGDIIIGNHPGYEAGTSFKVCFALVSKSHTDRFIEFRFNATLK